MGDAGLPPNEDDLPPHEDDLPRRRVMVRIVEMVDEEPADALSNPGGEGHVGSHHGRMGTKRELHRVPLRMSHDVTAVEIQSVHDWTTLHAAATAASARRKHHWCAHRVVSVSVHAPSELRSLEADAAATTGRPTTGRPTTGRPTTAPGSAAREGLLTFVDLAGSEVAPLAQGGRAGRAGTAAQPRETQRQREARARKMSARKGLLAADALLLAAARGQPFLPFRGSRLTHLLQELLVSEPRSAPRPAGARADVGLVSVVASVAARSDEVFEYPAPHSAVDGRSRAAALATVDRATNLSFDLAKAVASRARAMRRRRETEEARRSGIRAAMMQRERQRAADEATAPEPASEDEMGGKATAAEKGAPVLQYECSGGCGFRGAYALVEAHEEGCPLAVRYREQGGSFGAAD
jgi:hypothetical protein